MIGIVQTKSSPYFGSLLDRKKIIEATHDAPAKKYVSIL